MDVFNEFIFLNEKWVIKNSIFFTKLQNWDSVEIHYSKHDPRLMFAFISQEMNASKANDFDRKLYVIPSYIFFSNYIFFWNVYISIMNDSMNPNIWTVVYLRAID